MSSDTDRSIEAAARGGPMTDDQLIELYWQRDEQALSATMTKYGPMLFSIAYNILHDRQDCEECQNDALLRAWNRIPPVRPRVLSAFLSKLMRDIAIDKYKERTGKKRVPTGMTVSLEELGNLLYREDSPEAAYLSDEAGRLVNDYVRRLPGRQRYIFIERFYLFSTVEHIAGELGVGLATVHRETEKIKEGLRAYLERNGVYV